MSLGYIPGCYGRSLKTGKRVGYRHRWSGGQCEWCGRDKEEVYKEGREAAKKEKQKKK